MDVDPVWLGVMIGINLQTSFLTPPVGFALFYLRGVAPPEVTTGHIYRGIIPFVAMQIIGMSLLWIFPQMATWLPDLLFADNAAVVRDAAEGGAGTVLDDLLRSDPGMPGTAPAPGGDSVLDQILRQGTDTVPLPPPGQGFGEPR